jgi:hypothetical protein
VHAALRAAVMSAAGALIERAVAQLTRRPPAAVDGPEPASDHTAPLDVDP